MKKLSLSILCFLCVLGIARSDITSRLNIQTQDGNTNAYPYQARFTNGTVTDNGDGTVSISNGGGSGGAGYNVEPATVTFNLARGVTATTATITGAANTTALSVVGSTTAFLASFSTSTVPGASPQGVYISSSILMVGTTIPISTELLNVKGVGNFTGARISGVSGTQGVTISGNGSIAAAAGASLDLTGAQGGNAAQSVTLASGSRSPTSGTSEHVLLTGTYAPSSGTGVLNAFQVQDTVNQTGGASGITRGILIGPTLTKAFDYRAFETTAYTDNLSNTYAGSSLQGDLRNLVTISTNVTTTVSQFALLSLAGPGVAASSTTITNDYALLISSVTSLATGSGTGAGTVTNSYGLAVFGSTSATNNYSAIFMNKPVGMGTNAPASLLHISSGTLTIDGNVSPALTVKGSGAPPDSQALCLLNGQLGHCTGVVGATGGCTCSVP